MRVLVRNFIVAKEWEGNTGAETRRAIGGFSVDGLRYYGMLGRVMNANLILVRHGESQGNSDKSHYITRPDYAMELTEKGEQQALECGKSIQEIFEVSGVYSARFYCSPFWRARQTLQCIQHSLDQSRFYAQFVIEDPRLREQEWGQNPSRNEKYTSEKQAEDEVRDKYSTFYYRFRNEGESCADVYDRACSFLSEFKTRNDQSDVTIGADVIVSHGMTIRLLLMKMLNLSVEQFENLANPHNCEIIKLNASKEGKYTLLSALRERTSSSEWKYKPLVFP